MCICMLMHRNSFRGQDLARFLCFILATLLLTWCARLKMLGLFRFIRPRKIANKNVKSSIFVATIEHLCSQLFHINLVWWHEKKNENQKLSCRWHCRETRYSDWNQLKWSSWHQLTVDPAFVSYDNLFLTSTIIATDFMRFTSPFFLTFILGRVCVCLSFCTFQSF